MEINDKEYDVYYNYCPLGNCCLLPVLFYFKYYRDRAEATAVCPAKKMSQIEEAEQLISQVFHILYTILPSLFWIALGRVICQKLAHFIKVDSFQRFLIEFAIFILPTIFIINVANKSAECVNVVIILVIVILLWKTKCLEKAMKRDYLIGPRPQMLTLGRATINVITAYCILAIDFESFPKSFRKTRRYGVGLMDLGIGLFAFAMGAVSFRPRRKSDIKKVMRIVISLITLGIARTVIIVAIDYNQDDHEYGRHLNAFFTLGLTKLFGTLVSAIVTKDQYLLPLSLVIIFIHEVVLQLGVAEFVMEDSLTRLNFIEANREGLFSLPGYVGIYIISMYLGSMWRTENVPLHSKELVGKLKSMTVICLAFWLFTILSAFTVSIARVTCNFGYISWTMGIASIMILLYLIIFDVILNTIWPVEESKSVTYFDGGEGASLIKSTNKIIVSDSRFALPVIVEALNKNGLVFFLIANILTGCVNIVWDTSSLSFFTGYVILFIYMLTTTSFIYILYRLKMRIG